MVAEVAESRHREKTFKFQKKKLESRKIFQLLQYELDQAKFQRKTHYIRRTRHDTIHGRPEELFFLPDLYGRQNQGTNISDLEIDSTYSQEGNHMEDATIIMNDVDE